MFRVSLREMFLLIAAVALAIMSLVAASPVWQAIIGLAAMFAAMIAVIVSLVDRGPSCAFAIGFAVAMLGYLLVVMNAQKFTLAQANQSTELAAYGGRLPTTLLLQYFYSGINRSGYYNSTTNQRISDSEAGTLTSIPGSGVLQTAAGVPVWYQELPPREAFMATGHFWWALLFGYVGAHVAQFVYSRRNREANSGA